MTTEKINNLISQGEGLTLEFKRAENGLPHSLYETICAFLNKSGGIILLGVTDNGLIVGVNQDKAEQYCKDIANESNNPQHFSPSFLLDAQIVTYQDKTLVSVFVPISSQVHRLNGKIFDRSVDGDYEVKTDHQIKEIYIRKSSYYSENTIYPYLYTSDFESGIVERTRNTIRRVRPDHPWNNLSENDFYKVAGLYRKDMATQTEGFTLAALLLFGKEESISSVLPHYKTEALLRKKDVDRYDDRETIRCNLIEAYDQLMTFINKHLPDKFYLENDVRISLRERIFREIISNMLIHREFTNGVLSSLIIYKDRVETKNANKPHYFGKLLPGAFEPFPKNPKIANFFVQLGLAENLGTGIRYIYRYSKFYSGNNFLYFSENDIFKVIIPLDNTVNDSSKLPLMGDIPMNGFNDTIGGAIGGAMGGAIGGAMGGAMGGAILSVRQQEIISLLKNNPSISYRKIAEQLQINPSAIQKFMNELKRLGFLQRVGGTKGFWKVLKR